MAQQSEPATYRRYQSAVVSHPGQILREAREAAGIEQRALAEELYLTLHYVQAIEAGEFSRLPGATFVRGYLRSYAKRMGIPEHRVLELYDEYLRDREENEGRSRREGVDAEIWHRRIWVGMGVLLLVLVALGLYAAFMPEPPAEVAADPGPATVTPARQGAALTANALADEATEIAARGTADPRRNP